MKKVLFLTTMLFTSSVFAEGYAGIYGSSVLNTKSETGAENKIDHNQAIMVFGLRTNSPVGVSGDLFFNSVGSGASAGLFINLGQVRLNGGVMAMDDRSTGSAGKFNTLHSTVDVKANYIGVDYKMLSVRYIRYDADHVYSKSGVVGHKHKDGKKIPIIGVIAKSNDTLSRDIIWAGVNFKF